MMRNNQFLALLSLLLLCNREVGALSKKTSLRRGVQEVAATATTEFRFNPIITTFEKHAALAQQQGCALASINSAEEQEAAVAAMEAFIGYPYRRTDDFQSAFAYIGAQVVPEASSPGIGSYTFEWIDGSGELSVQRRYQESSSGYSNFISSDPNGGTSGFEEEKYVALSLNENGSSGIPRGKWVDFSTRNSPALYKCCISSPPVTCDTMSYQFSPLELGWEDHKTKAEEMGCQLASIKSPEDQAAAEAAIEPFIGFEYQSQGFFHNSFIYIGAELDDDASKPGQGKYTFAWADGSGTFDVERGINTASEPYTNFIPGDPNGRIGKFKDERYVALSLNEKDSVGIPRGKWVDFSNQPSPALYQCCVPPPESLALCTPGDRPTTPTPAPNAAPTPPTPTQEYLQNTLCQAEFTAIKDTGTPLEVNPTGTISLANPFLFQGNTPIDTLVVTQAGTINLNGDQVSVSGEVPIAPDGTGYESIARIQVGQAEFTSASVYYIETEEFIVISWENANAFRKSLAFQAKLFLESGTIEMTWRGDAGYSGQFTRATVGIEDGNGFAWPAQGQATLPWEYPLYFSDIGTGSVWSGGSDKCRLFVVAGGPPTAAPTRSPSPPPTPSPTFGILDFEPFTINLTGDQVVPPVDTTTTGTATIEPTSDGQGALFTFRINNPDMGEGFGGQFRCGASGEHGTYFRGIRTGPLTSASEIEFMNVITQEEIDPSGIFSVCSPSLATYVEDLRNGDAFIIITSTDNLNTIRGTGGVMTTPSPVLAPTSGPLAPSAIYTESATDCDPTFRPLEGDADRQELFLPTGPPETDVISLPRPFLFKGTDPIMELVVTEYGSINLNGSLEAVFGTVPVAIGGEGYEQVPRIQVAQGGIDISTVSCTNGICGGVHWQDTGASIIISWEAGKIAGRATVEGFQAELFDNGDIEMRWKGAGEGSFIDQFFQNSVGIEDGVGLAVPGEGAPFQEFGLNGPAGVFAQDTCRFFKARKGKYSQNTRDCSTTYEFIRETGTRLNIGVPPPPAVTLELPRPFLFKGTEPLTKLVISDKGTINLDGSFDFLTGSRPIEFGDNYETPRIQVAQRTYDVFGTCLTTPRAEGCPRLFWKDLGASIIISWENFRPGQPRVSFQVELFDSGDIVMNWQEGSGPYNEFINIGAGIEDGQGLAVPASGEFFKDSGLSGTPSVFEQDNCRIFSIL